ncbi:MAG: Rieske (2Fe-2S) protein [Deltaproteobacteria bacterium]|nr:Rieske (2Fe-2S) protein [Deltaproteobacteria bacterium]MCL5276749.1 Rieske (2Fe-2S) protein [Deltaproteobacteria bacterium]
MPDNDKEGKNTETQISRRRFLSYISGFFIVGGFLMQGLTALRSLFPRVLYEPPTKFKVGMPSDFPEGVRFIPEHRLFVIRDNDRFHCISAICTHLGCTVNLASYSPPKEYKSTSGTEVSETYEFHCPCHGSKYRENGNVYAGPAPKALPWFSMYLAPDGQIVVDTNVHVGHDFRLKV